MSTPSARKPATDRSRASRIFFFGVPVDLLTLEETVGRASRAMSERVLTRHTALNVAKLINLRSNAELADDVNSSDIVGIDGQGIIYGLRLFGAPSCERVAGIDLFYALLAHCAETGRRPFILGARQDALDAAIEEAKRRNPGLEFAGSRNGYFTPEETPAIVEEIRASNADCLFVAMPTPRKERFLNAHAGKLDVPFIMGVGGSVDVLAGRVPRAPAWMQKIGLEWFHRLIKEPGKMIGRYTRTNSLYAFLLAGALFKRRSPIERG